MVIFPPLTRCTPVITGIPKLLERSGIEVGLAVDIVTEEPEANTAVMLLASVGPIK